MTQWRLAEFDNSPDFQNDAPNSVEQDAALKNAVDRALELQTQGKTDEDIVAILSGEGISQPEQVMQMLHLRQKKDFAAPEGQDGQPAVSTQEPYPPQTSDAVPDTSLYSKFVSYVNSKSAGMDDVSEGGHGWDEMGWNPDNAGGGGHSADELGWDQPQANPVTHDAMVQAAQQYSQGGQKPVYDMDGLHGIYQNLVQRGHAPEDVRNAVVNNFAQNIRIPHDSLHQVLDSYLNNRTEPPSPNEQFFSKNSESIMTESMQKGSPYPENSEKNAPDHSAPGHHLPDKVNQIYNACMREHSDYGKEKCMKIAWAASGDKHEKSGQVTFKGVPGKISATYENIYGEVMARFSTDTQVVDIPAHDLDVDEMADTSPQSASEILNQWLETIPEASNAEEAVERSAKMREIHTAASAAIANSKLPLTEKMALDKVSLRARVEMADLKYKFADDTSEQEYLDRQPKYDILVGNGGGLSDGSSDAWLDSEYRELQEQAANTDYDQVNEEQAALTVAAAHKDDLHDTVVIRSIARSRFRTAAWAAGVDDETRSRVESDYLERVENKRRERLATFKEEIKKQASVTDSRPDEMMFL